VSDILLSPKAICPNPRENSSRYHSTEVWVGLRVGLEVLGVGKKTFASVTMQTAIPHSSRQPPGYCTAELATPASEYNEILFIDIVQSIQCCALVITYVQLKAQLDVYVLICILYSSLF
jgi:hypothetical protein